MVTTPYINSLLKNLYHNNQTLMIDIYWKHMNRLNNKSNSNNNYNIN